MSITLIKNKFEDVSVHELKNYNIDLIIFDPPDNINLKYDNYIDKVPDKFYYIQLEQWLYKCKQTTSGPIFFTFNKKWIYEVENIIYNLKIPLIQRIYWHFTFGQNQQKQYTNCIRPVYWLNSDFIIPDNIKIPSDRQTKYKDKRAKPNGKMPSDLWEFPRVCGTFKERRPWHPCQLPENMIERIILGHSKPGFTILDPAIGSGTTAIVANRLHRNIVGIDSSKFYIEQVKKELQL